MSLWPTATEAAATNSWVLDRQERGTAVRLLRCREEPRAECAPNQGREEGVMVESLYERIYDIVRQVPKGRVATYGTVARAVGMPRGARQVGYAMAALGRGAPRPDVPWHRIVNARGESSIGEEQISRLRAEGVEFGPDGRIDLRQFNWDAEGSDEFGGEGLFG